MWEEVFLLCGVVREGLSGKMAIQTQIPEGRKTEIHVAIWGKESSETEENEMALGGKLTCTLGRRGRGGRGRWHKDHGFSSEMTLEGRTPLHGRDGVC